EEQEILEACKLQIQKILEKENHIIFLFNRFDEFGKEIDQKFLGNIRTLRHIAADKISIIFVSHKPLYEISPKAISGGNLDVYSNFYYFKPYSDPELISLLQLHSPELVSDKKKLQNALQLSGGHFQLLQLILKSERPNSLGEDRFLKLSLKEIYESFSYAQKKELKKIAFGKKVLDPDPYLSNIGLISKKTGKLFSPFFTEYI